ncbi:MAG: symporter [bacterium]|nr:MAG: symporter [bacterium]
MDTLEAFDHIRLNFSPGGLQALNVALAFVMFGVALGIKLEHFKKLLLNPVSAIVGVLSQFFVLPFMTFVLIVLLKDFITPTIALGMILVAACPGGNISNFISSLAKANVALSVSLTAIATLAAVFMTPLNFALWGNLYTRFLAHSSAVQLVRPLHIDMLQMFQTVFLILGIPLVTGIFVNTKWPDFTKKITKPIKRFSIFLFVAIVVIAFWKNFDFFLIVIKYIFLIVLVQNTLAFASGYYMARIFKRPSIDRRTISIETGIQNSGLALVLIFNPKIFPPDMELGGMAIIAAWWGIWHIVAGLTLAGIWNKPKISFKLKSLLKNR